MLTNIFSWTTILKPRQNFLISPKRQKFTELPAGSIGFLIDLHLEGRTLTSEKEISFCWYCNFLTLFLIDNYSKKK